MKVPAWKRKAASKKYAAVGRRRVGLRRGMLVGRGLRQPVQFFKRSAWLPAALAVQNQLSSGAPVQYNFTPSLDSVPNYTEFTSLYDQYQIKGVKISFFPKFSQVEGVTAPPSGNWGGVNAMPQCMSIVDTDGNFPSTIQGFVQYQNLKITRGNKIHSRYFQPRALSLTYNTSTSVTNGYSPRARTWLDCDTPSVKHYGFAIIFDTNGMDENVILKYDIKVDFYLAMKNVR